jgi:hypothetical protein
MEFVWSAERYLKTLQEHFDVFVSAHIIVAQTLVSLLKIRSEGSMCPRRTELNFSKVFNVSGCPSSFYISLANPLKCPRSKSKFCLLSESKSCSHSTCLLPVLAQKLSVYIFVFCHLATSSLSGPFCSGSEYQSDEIMFPSSVLPSFCSGSKYDQDEIMFSSSVSERPTLRLYVWPVQGTLRACFLPPLQKLFQNLFGADSISYCSKNRPAHFSLLKTQFGKSMRPQRTEQNLFKLCLCWTPCSL